MSSEHIGILLGVVEDNKDPRGEGRVRVRFTTFTGNLVSDFIPIIVPMAGKKRGFRTSPEEGDECVVVFDRGDPDNGYVVGFLHNGVDTTPSDANNKRVIVSVNGHRVEMFDTVDGPGTSPGNKGHLLLADGHGNQIELTNGHMRITAVGQLDITAATVTIQGRPVVPGSGPM